MVAKNTILDTSTCEKASPCIISSLGKRECKIEHFFIYIYIYRPKMLIITKKNQHLKNNNTID